MIFQKQITKVGSIILIAIIFLCNTWVVSAYTLLEDLEDGRTFYAQGKFQDSIDFFLMKISENEDISYREECEFWLVQSYIELADIKTSKNLATSFLERYSESQFKPLIIFQTARLEFLDNNFIASITYLIDYLEITNHKGQFIQECYFYISESLFFSDLYYEAEPYYITFLNVFPESLKNPIVKERLRTIQNKKDEEAKRIQEALESEKMAQQELNRKLYSLIPIENALFDLLNDLKNNGAEL